MLYNSCLITWSEKKKIHHLEKKFHPHGDDEELLDHRVSYLVLLVHLCILLIMHA